MPFLEHERVRELLARAGLADASPPMLGAIAAVTVLICMLGVWRFWPSSVAPEVAFHDSPVETAADAGVIDTAAVSSEVVVHVAGAVVRPGVYRLPNGSRVTDAVAAAGGPLGSAATDAVNLARVLSDGEQVYLPSADEAVAGVASPGSGSAGASDPSSGLVNLNTASAAELETLPGIGAATAQKIVDDREKNGPFTAPEDLMRVTGIGEKKFEALKDLVSAR